MAGVGLGQGLALDHAAHAVDVDDGRHAGRGHEHAAVGRVLEQAFLGQRAKHFAQRIARDVQGVAQRRFGQFLPGHELSLDNFLSHHVRDAFVEAGGGDGKLGSRSHGWVVVRRHGRSVPGRGGVRHAGRMAQPCGSGPLCRQPHVRAAVVAILVT
ncbi:hypothetical protein D3C78_1207790 [compost metagenome]